MQKDWPLTLGLPLWVWIFVLPTALTGLCWFYAPQLRPRLEPLWRGMDRVYTAAGAIAACALMVILLIMVAQMGARWAGVTFSGSTKYAGYMMAISSFFGLAYALRHGAHIRVSLLLTVNAWTARWLDRAALLLAAWIATYFARFAIKQANNKWLLKERTDDLDTVPEWLLSTMRMFVNAPGDWAVIWAETGDAWVPTPMWLPKIAMTLGTVLLAVAFWDLLIRTLVTDKNPIETEGVAE